MGDTRVCEFCGKPGIQGQPFSGGKEYYCPSCDEVYAFGEAAQVPRRDMVAFYDEAIQLVLDAVDCQGTMCPGPDAPLQDMITCRVCALVQHFREEREKWRLLDTSSPS